MRRRPGDPLVNALRLAFGTLTVLPVAAPTVDRRTAGRAMALAPLVGLTLALVVSPLTLLDGSPLLVAALVVGALALLTRGLHLDGLADTADGLGSGRPADGALEVMRRSDIGPFGVVTLVLVLLVQVVALAQLLASGSGALLLAGRPRGQPAGPAARLPRRCPRRAARRPRRHRRRVGVAADGRPLRPAGRGACSAWPRWGWGGRSCSAPVGLLGGLAVGRRAVRRLGGVTGDVLGAVVEATFTAALVLPCLV